MPNLKIFNGFEPQAKVKHSHDNNYEDEEF